MSIPQYVCISVTWPTTKPKVLSEYDAHYNHHSHYKMKDMLVLNTCNRFEAYLVVPDATRDVEQYMFDRCSLIKTLPDARVEVFKGKEAERHLFRVACGLESNIIGEQEILRQIKQLSSHDQNLNVLLNSAVEIGKISRATTTISQGNTKLSSCIMSIATTQKPNGNVGIIGFGHVGRDVYKASRNFGFSGIKISTRSLPHDMDASSIVPTQTLIDTCDIIVIGVTSPLVDIDWKHVQSRLVVDMSVPPVVEPDALHSSCSLLTYDDMTQIMNEEVSKRLEAVPVVESLIEKKLDSLQFQRQMSEFNEDKQIITSHVDRIFTTIPKPHNKLKHAIMKKLNDKHVSHDDKRILVDVMKSLLEDIS